MFGNSKPYLLKSLLCVQLYDGVRLNRFFLWKQLKRSITVVHAVSLKRFCN